MKKITFILIASLLSLNIFSQNIFNTKKSKKPTLEIKKNTDYEGSLKKEDQKIEKIKNKKSIIKKDIDSDNYTYRDYKISGEIIGLKDTTVILAYYFGGKQFARDTAFSINGKFTFQSKKELKGGMYLVVLPKGRFFDVIISEREFSFKTNIDNLIGEMSFKNSNENPPFYEYLNFITKKQNQITPIKNQLQQKDLDSKIKKQLEANAKKIDEEVKLFRKNYLLMHPDIFFSKIIKATSEPNIPKQSIGDPETFPFRYYKKHFWDNIDFSDSRMLRTPVFFSKMDQYLERLTAKQPDSVNKSADIIVNKAMNNSEIFEYVVSYITSTYERSKIMGMDAVFVHMVENYYIPGYCNWVDEEQLQKIIERAEKIAPNLIGKKAPEFLDALGRPFMKDLSGKIYRLSDMKSDYTVLAFYGPTCGHCKKEMPKVKNTIDSLQLEGYDISVFAVATEFDKEEWKKFIEEQKTDKWINVADINHDDEGNPVASSDWRDKYDIYSTPVVYLLDENQNIIAKRIVHKQIKEIIERRAQADLEIDSNYK